VQLSGLHVPGSYLAAVIQTAAGKNQWPLDKVTFYTEVTQWSTAGKTNSSVVSDRTSLPRSDAIDESVQGLCIVDGLFLEGAGWDRVNGCLVEQPRKQLLQSMPLMKIVPIEAHRHPMHNCLPTPVYVTSDRRNAMGLGWVFEASLQTKKDLSHWILNGVCLLLNTD
jgi:dynein heavy chain, axonemal